MVVYLQRCTVGHTGLKGEFKVLRTFCRLRFVLHHSRLQHNTRTEHEKQLTVILRFTLVISGSVPEVRKLKGEGQLINVMMR